MQSSQQGKDIVLSQERVITHKLNIRIDCELGNEFILCTSTELWHKITLGPQS